MRNKLFNNAGLKILSVVLATILWFLVVQIEDPQDSKTLSDIKVKLINTSLLENENKVYRVLDNTDTVSVTVKAPKSVISQLRSSDIVAQADVGKLTDINTVAITYSIENVDSDYTIQGNHDSVKLDVEDRKTKWVKLRYSTTGEVAEGYMVASASPDQTQVEVSGPASVVDAVSYAKVDIDVTDATSNLSVSVDISLFDSEDNQIDQQTITKNVDYVHMTVEVLATKEIPVKVNFSGEPAEGYGTTGEVTCSPSSITVAATPSALANIDALEIPAEAIDITDAKETVEASLYARDYLDDNVKLASFESDYKLTVNIGIEEVQELNVSVRPNRVSFENVPSGIDVSADNDVEVNLKLKGLTSVISGLNTSSLRGTADIGKYFDDNGLTSTEDRVGVYMIPVEFNFPDGVTVEKTPVIRVEVTEK
ncbi:MAG: hypothetical protein J6033_02280 [Lachnospiraceae bacterium]|nr:hypothetical protein [Lachnospiraceae bacterium]